MTSVPPIPVSFSKSKIYDVDYSTNATGLFKLIEGKKWDSVKERINAYPEEACGWITRYGEDGKVRWKLLPLHAALCLRAPVDVILKIFRTFPDAATIADDQGMLPIHLALKDDSISNDVVRALLSSYPSTVNAKDSKGRIPIEMRGKSALSVLEMTLNLQKKKLKNQEKIVVEGKLAQERVLNESEIKKLEDQIAELSVFKSISERKEQELIEITKQVANLEKKCTEIENLNEDQKVNMATQIIQLGQKESTLKNAREKLISQEDLLLKQKDIEQAHAQELTNAMKTIKDLRSKILAQDLLIAKYTGAEKVQETRPVPETTADEKSMDEKNPEIIETKPLIEPAIGVKGKQPLDSNVVRKVQMETPKAESSPPQHEYSDFRQILEQEKALLDEVKKLRESCKTRDLKSNSPTVPGESEDFDSKINTLMRSVDSDIMNQKREIEKEKDQTQSTTKLQIGNGTGATMDDVKDEMEQDAVVQNQNQEVASPPTEPLLSMKEDASAKDQKNDPYLSIEVKDENAAAAAPPTTSEVPTAEEKSTIPPPHPEEVDTYCYGCLLI